LFEILTASSKTSASRCRLSAVFAAVGVVSEAIKWSLAMLLMDPDEYCKGMADVLGELKGGRAMEARPLKGLARSAKPILAASCCDGRLDA
jgi:hypothetical protein